MIDINPTEGLTKEEKLDYLITSNPVLWANKNFNWEARDYQVSPLQFAPKSRQLVFRLGRRLGKTEMSCILILWYAFTQINKFNPKEDKYNILIVCPYEKQVDLIFDRLRQLIEMSEDYKNSIVRDVQHRLELNNGTVIQGMTAGSKNNSGAANTRGQRAELVFLDEADYLGESDITNIINLRNEDPTKIRLIAASTPSGKRASYFKWCTEASNKFSAHVDDNLSMKVTYKRDKNPNGNGWTEFFAPSTVNKKVFELNPDTGLRYIDEFRNELTEERFEQEVMAGFGEEAGGVFLKRYIDKAKDNGRKLGISKYYDELTPEEQLEWRQKNAFNKKIIGVDWDKVCAGPTFVGVMLNNETKMFEVFLRKELPRTQFTYLDAVDELIRLNADVNPDWIYMDKGAGDVQYELIKRHGVENPSSNLVTKVIANQLAEKTDVVDIHTKKATKMPIKPTMINNAALVFEKEKIALNPHDKLMITQIESFRIKRVSSLGQPIYEDGDDHIIDALSRALFGFAKQYDSMFKRTMTTAMRIVGDLDTQDMNYKRNKIETEKNDAFTVTSITMGGKKETVSFDYYEDDNWGRSSRRNSRKTRKMPSRRSF